jgi:riboflavin kinase/FMN adenylyltransferase
MIVRTTDLKHIVPFVKDTALCLGFFDGVHLGHQSLIKAAKNTLMDVALLTFDRSPKNNPLLITSFQERTRLLKDLGVKILIVVSFSDEVKDSSAETFIDFLNRLNVKKVVCGMDFRFGKKALGNATLLKRGQFNGFETIIVDDVLEQGVKISSSKIINLLQNGELETANKQLGRTFSVNGTVKKGNQIGRKLGFPTANIKLDSNYVLPINGVYITAITIKKRRFYSISSLGYHPTISPVDTPVLEVHIIDFKRVIYRQKVKVEFLKYLRPEAKFDTVEQLIDKMNEDLLIARGYKDQLGF